MAYADEGMSRNRMIALGLVALLHVFLGYAFITGLALKAVKAIVNPLETVNVKEEAPPPEEPPPPPPKDIEIPPFVPPPEVSIAQDAPTNAITTQNTVPQPEPPRYVAPTPAPPAPTGPTTPAQFDARSLAVSEDDYPPSSLRAEEEGLVKVKVTIGTNGRVTTCEIVGPSGFPKLDEKSCRLAQTRWRSKPALENGTPVASTIVKSVRWQIRK
jgi:periplasmic protein TonB